MLLSRTLCPPPNGVQNFLRNDDSDNLIHWHWTVAHADGLFDVQGANFRTFFFASGLRDFQLYQSEDLVAALKADFANDGRGMSECRKSLEHWFEFVSPYQRLRRSVEQMLEELARLDPDSVSEPSMSVDPTDTTAQAKLREEWVAAANTLNRAFGICFGIRSMLSVMAEAFVNLLMFCLMRQDIRADARLRENAFRQHIDVRVRSLHLNCRGFAESVDFSDPACARFHSLMNERNDLLHGNVSISKLQFNELFSSGTVPIFKTYRSMWTRAFEVQRRSVGLPQVRDEYKVVLDFIDCVMSRLTVPVRENLQQVLASMELGYNVDDDRVGLLFAERLVDFRLPSQGVQAKRELCRLAQALTSGSAQIGATVPKGCLPALC